MSVDADSMPRPVAGSVSRSMSARRTQSAGKPPLSHAHASPKRPATVGAVMGRARQHGNDLQTYAVMLEEHLHDRKRQMITLAAEKRHLELLLLRQQRLSHDQPKFGDLFNGKESLDIPAKMRAIIEDNHGLKDKSRKLRLECGRLHRLSSELTAEKHLLQSQLREAQHRLTQCSVTAKQMDELQERLKASAQLARQVRLLTSENKILRHKMDADFLRSRQEKCSAKRDQQKLAAQVRKLNSEAHTKSLEVQCLNSQLKEERRRIKQLQKQLRLIQPAVESATCSVLPLSSVERVDENEVQAALRIQAAYKGHRARARLGKVPLRQSCVGPGLVGCVRIERTSSASNLNEKGEDSQPGRTTSTHTFGFCDDGCAARSPSRSCQRRSSGGPSSTTRSAIDKRAAAYDADRHLGTTSGEMIATSRSSPWEGCHEPPADQGQQQERTDGETPGDENADIGRPCHSCSEEEHTEAVVGTRMQTSSVACSMGKPDPADGPPEACIHATITPESVDAV